MIKGTKHSLKSRRKISVANINRPCSIETRLKMSKARIGRKRSPESCKRISLSKQGNKHPMFGKRHTFEARQRMSIARKGDKHPMFGKKHNLKSIKKMSLARKLIWKNPQYRDTILRKLLSGSNRFPNEFETRALIYLNKRHPNEFKYCGDGSVLICGRSPDAINERKKEIALFHGTYWHCSPKIYKANYYNRRLGKTAKQIWKEDRKAINLFKQAGYRVVIIWEDIIKNEL